MSSSISVIIPTLNSGKRLELILKILVKQSIEISEIIIVDSSSTDSTYSVAEKFGAKVFQIQRVDFNHASTRTFAAKKSTGDYIIFLTDDAVPANKEFIRNLIGPFSDGHVAAVCARQIAPVHVGPVGQHLRSFNYPDYSFSRTQEDSNKYGFKTVFMSNSAAAYRRKSLESISWFGENQSFGEDSVACAKLLLKGQKIQYSSNAIVYHGHDYSILQEFKRYVNVGSFHHEFSWLIEEFGSPESEGLRYVKSELKFMIKHRHYYQLFLLPPRMIAKWSGYKLGKLLGDKSFIVNKSKMYK